jgi:citrate synthase
MTHTIVHSDVTQMMKSFRYDAHPMSVLISTISALSSFHPEQNPALQGGHKVYKDETLVNKQIFRILGNMPTLAANAYRIRIGRDFNHPNSNFGYVQVRSLEDSEKSNRKEFPLHAR